MMQIQNEVAFFKSTSPQINSIRKRIDELQNLQPGWDFGEGEAISYSVAKMCLYICEYGDSFGLRVNVRPATDGSLVAGLFYDDNFLYININNDGLFDITYEKGIGINYDILDEKENLNLNTLETYIYTWYSSGRYIGKNIMKRANASQAIASTNTRVEFPYLKRNAPEQRVTTPYVNTSRASTRRQLELQ